MKDSRRLWHGSGTAAADWGAMISNPLRRAACGRSDCSILEQDLQEPIYLCSAVWVEVTFVCQIGYTGVSRKEDAGDALRRNDVTAGNLHESAALNNMGVALERQGRYEALAAFSAAPSATTTTSCLNNAVIHPARPPPGSGARLHPGARP